MMALGLALMGLTYGPLGTVISELFPTRVRYTGSSLAFSLGGILGASFAPTIATNLARNHRPALGSATTSPPPPSSASSACYSSAKPATTTSPSPAPVL